MLADDDTLIGESRWPPTVALVLFLALDVVVRAWVPGDGVFRVPWLTPALMVALLVVVLAADPTGRRERRRLHRLTLVLVGLSVVAALWATGLLIADLIAGRGPANDPEQLLASGALVWLGNNLVFGLLYWSLDGGGPGVRSRATGPADFAFPQHLSPEVLRVGWRPTFPDYVYLGFTNATALSPTDVMPLTHRAKAAMAVQATIALALLGLVLARAVNAFS